jgi:hypothetical protein
MTVLDAPRCLSARTCAQSATVTISVAIHLDNMPSATDEARTCTCSLTHAGHAKASHALPNGCSTGDQAELRNIRINTALRTTGSRITSNPMGQQYALGASCSTASRASREMVRGEVFLCDSSVVPAAASAAEFASSDPPQPEWVIDPFSENELIVI